MNEEMVIKRVGPAPNTIITTRIVDAYAETKITNKKAASTVTEERFLEALARHLEKSANGFEYYKFLVMKSGLHCYTSRYSKRNLQGCISINICNTRRERRHAFIRALCQHLSAAGGGFEEGGRKCLRLGVAID